MADVILNALTPHLPLIAGLAMITWLLQSPRFKGWLGEAMVNLKLRLGLRRQVYCVFHNVLLPTPSGTTQVDHIVLSPFGVFVIETKHYAGWIFGSEHQPTWTQTLGGRRYRFQNPLHQNYAHTKAVQALMGLPAESVFSIVVFTGKAKLKSALPANVFTDSGYLAYIRAHRTPQLDADTLATCHQRLAAAKAASSRAAAKAHVQMLRTRSSDS